MTSAERVRRYRERLRASAPPPRPAPDQETAQALAAAQKRIGVLLQEIDQLRRQVEALKKTARPAAAPSSSAFTTAELAKLLLAWHPDHVKHPDIVERRRAALEIVMARMKKARRR